MANFTDWPSKGPETAEEKQTRQYSAVHNLVGKVRHAFFRLLCVNEMFAFGVTTIQIRVIIRHPCATVQHAGSGKDEQR